MTKRILVPIDFSPCSDAALEHALAIADDADAEVEVLYVWCPHEPSSQAAGGSAIFADTPQGIAMQQRLSAAESAHAARVCGRLEFGDEPSRVILAILQREHFDMVVVGPATGRVTACLAKTTHCRVVTSPPPAEPSSAKIVAA
jgi:nucleotide-binding universal stress UspA family protein